MMKKENEKLKKEIVELNSIVKGINNTLDQINDFSFISIDLLDNLKKRKIDVI